MAFLRQGFGRGGGPGRDHSPDQFTTNTEACGRCNREERVPLKAKEGTAVAEVSPNLLLLPTGILPWRCSLWTRCCIFSPPLVAEVVLFICCLLFFLSKFASKVGLVIEEQNQI